MVYEAGETWARAPKESFIEMIPFRAAARPPGVTCEDSFPAPVKTADAVWCFVSSDDQSH